MQGQEKTVHALVDDPVAKGQDRSGDYPAKHAISPDSGPQQRNIETIVTLFPKLTVAGTLGGEETSDSTLQSAFCPLWFGGNQ